MSDLKQWLEGLGLAQYYDVLRENDVDLEIVTELSESDLEALGFSLGHRKKLLKAISSGRSPRHQEHADKLQSQAKLTGEYRYLTAMFCDLVGSTSMTAEIGAEEMREILQHYHQACREVIESYEGYIARYMGDGVLVYFGFPVSLEDSAERAILAGLGVVKRIQDLFSSFEQYKSVDLSVRIGLATGKVVIDHIGAGESEESNAVGDALNIAARLQGLATPNQIVADDTTKQLAGTGFSYQDIGQHELKGVAEPVQVWQVAGTREVQSRFAAGRGAKLGQFIGRQRELQQIDQCWKRAIGTHGQMVVVQAEPGMGKSRLGEEVKRRLDKFSHETLVFQCSPYHQNVALYPVLKGLRFWLGLGKEGSADEKLDAIVARVRRSGLDEETTVPLIAEFVGVDYTDRFRLPDLSPQKQKEETLEAVNALLCRSSATLPIFIFFEDLQWVDPSTQEWLLLLLESLEKSRLLVYATCRNEYPIPAEWHRDNFIVIKLEQMDQADVQMMVLSITGGKPLPKPVFDAICQKTEGSPLFVEDVTLMTLESDFIEERNGELVLKDKFHNLTIPDSLQESLVARLNKLEGVRLVGQVGAVIGRKFSHQLIHEITPIEPDKIDLALSQLTEAGFLNQAGTGEGSSFVFKHALIQDALYESLLRRERKLFHLKIARSLEQDPERVSRRPQLLAQHFAAGDEHRKAVEYGIRAGQQSAAKYANVESIRSVSLALASLENMPAGSERNQLEIQLHSIQGPGLLATQGWSSPELGRAYTRASELCEIEGETEKLFTIKRGLWGFYAAGTKLERAVGIGQEMLEQAEIEDSDDKRIEARASLSDSYFWMGQVVEAEHHADIGLALYDFDKHHESHTLEYGEDPSGLMRCYHCLANLILGRDDVASASIALAEQSLRQFTHAFSRGFLLIGLAWFHNHSRNPRLGRKFALQLLELADTNDFSPWQCAAKIQLGWSNAMLDKNSEGTAMMREGIEFWCTYGGITPSWMTYSMLIDAYMHGGEYQMALTEIENAQNNLVDSEERLFYSEVLRQRAFVLARLNGEAREISDLYEQAIEQAKAQQATLFLQRIREDMEGYFGLKSEQLTAGSENGPANWQGKGITNKFTH